MKYRRLTIDELQEMEKEFINFLATRGVPGDDWVKIKNEDPERTNVLLDEFSNLVFEKILRDVEFMELKTPKDIKVFKCGKEKIELMGIMISGETNLSFTGDVPPAQMIGELQNTGVQVQLYQAEKGYKDNREKELFSMMEAGCTITKGDFFDLLNQLTTN